ncbi:MAG: OmpA family protein, partial [Odoribacteraceae bacterium]|nr:OmpA family protein [Odoribacteraceae bacterium]
LRLASPVTPRSSPAPAPARGLSIAFHPGSNRLDPELDNNWEILTDILSTIRAIEYSGDSRVTRVIVEGHASLDASHEQNTTIAWQRADAVREYLARRAGLPPDVFRVHNAGEDWEGLRALVEQSYMPSREAVLHVIDRVPVWDHVLHTGRQKILQTLHDGHPYRYMRDYFFPHLRRAALVRIYYTNIP